MVGSSIAWHLARAGAAADVVVVEPDPTYAHAATPRATGTIRRVFSLPENIAMSAYAHDIYGEFEALMVIDGAPAAHVDLRRGGYLVLTQGAASVQSLQASAATMHSLGTRVEMLDPSALQSRFPLIRVDDVDAALYSPDDGWIDPNGALQGFRKMARQLGVQYIKDRVVEIEVTAGLVRSVGLESGQRLPADVVVNCANCHAPQVCAMVGMPVDIVPIRRLTFYFDVQCALAHLPLIRDDNGISVRPEGTGYICGVSNRDEPPGFNWEVDHAWFDDVVWPRIAHRVPAFETIKAGRSWSCHYDMHRLDANPIIGPWIGGVENFYIAAGFSGHGLQHAPAIGRGLAELLLCGRYESLDLNRLSYQRVLDQRPLADAGPHS